MDGPVKYTDLLISMYTGWQKSPKIIRGHARLLGRPEYANSISDKNALKNL